VAQSEVKSGAVNNNRRDVIDMGREQMRNLEISKIGATQVNEFEYQKHQGEMTEQEHAGAQGGSGKRLTQAERVAQITAAAHKKVEKKRKKEGAKSGSTKRKATPKKKKK
jgi:hypothetical protein